MKRIPLFLLLLLMSFRLVASVAGLGLNGVDVPGKKAYYTASHGTSETQWLLAELEPAEESEEDPDEGFHPAELVALTAWVLALVPTDFVAFASVSALFNVSAQPLFLLFQNFRI